MLKAKIEVRRNGNLVYVNNSLSIPTLGILDAYINIFRASLGEGYNVEVAKTYISSQYYDDGVKTAHYRKHKK